MAGFWKKKEEKASDKPIPTQGIHQQTDFARLSLHCRLLKLFIIQAFLGPFVCVFLKDELGNLFLTYRAQQRSKRHLLCKQYKVLSIFH